jgi:Spy/CpxP family protein refolding chaperone
MALVASTSVALAQQERRGGGRGGFGGFGGGFGGGGIGILRMEEVQKELKLTDDQKKDVEALQARVREEMPRFERGGQDLTQEERQKRGEEFAKKAQEVNTKAEGDLAKILKPDQMTRFEQLKLQREGASALAQKATADKLSLTEDQRKKIQDTIAASRESMRGVFNPNATDDERRAAMTKMREAREKLQTDLVAVLTPEQKSAWDKMLGAKFDFPAFGGGGGRGGRGGNGGAGGGGQRQRPAGNN